MHRQADTIAALEELRPQPAGRARAGSRRRPGSAPRRAVQLNRELGIATIADLTEAIKADAGSADRGFKVAWGRCWEAGGAPAHWPRGRGPAALRSRRWWQGTPDTAGSGDAFAAQVAAEIAEILPYVRPLPLTAAEAARFRLFDGPEDTPEPDELRAPVRGIGTAPSRSE